MRLPERENEPPTHHSAAPALHQALVDGLMRRGNLHSRTVAAAFRAVPRHLFLPGVPLQEAYSDQAVPIKTDATGNVLSASSQPPIMAIMLEQLDLRPGHRVLEVGAGSGYNAALMAHIVGKTGQVLTLDIDPDLVDAAREHLAAAGLSRVRVVCADGGYGYADAAPYDRIIITAGAWDITPSWWEQLRPGGRLLLPLAIKGEQKSVAFERRGDHLVSLSVRDCGFMPLRGAFADPQPSNVIPLGPDPGLELWLRGEHALDASRAYHWLTGPSRDWGVNVTAAVHELISGLWLWLGLHEPHRGRIVAWDDMVDREMVPHLIGLGGPRKLVFAPVLLGETGLAALMRPPGQPAPLVNVNDLYTPGPPFALFVRQFGADEALAQRLISRIRAWDAAGRPSSAGLHIRAYAQTFKHLPPKVAGEIWVEKRWTHLILDWPQHAQTPADERKTMITGIAHLCIASTDLNRTLAFYTQALGFQKRFAFLRNDREIGYYLQIAERAYVEVFLQEHAPSLEQPAIRHMCLQVDGIDHTIRRIRQAGYEASDKKLGADQTWQAWTTDPDGIRIELHEYTELSSQYTGKDVTVDW